MPCECLPNITQLGTILSDRKDHNGVTVAHNRLTNTVILKAALGDPKGAPTATRGLQAEETKVGGKIN